MNYSRLANSSQQMVELGQSLAEFLRPGDNIELIGDVGAGKTTFTGGVARGLGVTGDIQSPTFTISRVYDLPDQNYLVHYDFYRLNQAGIMGDEFYESIEDQKTIVIIEWGDIVDDILPAERISITITPLTVDKRRLEVRTDRDLSKWYTEAI